MVVVGIVALALGIVIVGLCAVADPVLLSRINGEDAEGSSGRRISVPRPSTDLVRMSRCGETSCEPQAA
ncbi:hypothetical protein SAMN05421505_112208 [Sinosporangium album]|uniref:Uncharacterized protein n=2 Tax=Sinosporangium album TaxID=504805 RepID=A0A1G8AKY3_9ACTN|nr:hypothetical protein SAMN05421505_112208 [Sinosporangium album]